MNSNPIPRRRNPFALVALIAMATGLAGIPVALIAGQQTAAIAIGGLAALVIYIAVSRGWAWVGSRVSPLAKNESVLFETSARSDAAREGTVTVTNRRVFYEPSAAAILRRRGTPPTGWELQKSAITALRRESQDPGGKSRGGAQRVVVESKSESHWLQPREFDALVEAISKATGLRASSPPGAS